VCPYVCTYMYGERKEESKYFFKCTFFLFINWTDYVWWSIRSRLTACIFPRLALPRMNNVDINFISLGCLIHVNPFASHIRGAWFTWVPFLLTFGNKWVYILLSDWMFKVSTILCDAIIYSILKNWSEEFPQHVMIELLHLFYESYCPS